MKIVTSILLLSTIFFIQDVNSQCCQQGTCPRCGCYHYPFAIPQPTTCSRAYCCYWQRYCQAERSWYETMDYPGYRNWPMWNRLSR